jgi:hypothetical protein
LTALRSIGARRSASCVALAVRHVRFGYAGAPAFGRAWEGYFKDVLDRFDRRFASRELALLEGPKEEGDAVWIRGRAT